MYVNGYFNFSSILLNDFYCEKIHIFYSISIDPVIFKKIIAVLAFNFMSSVCEII